MRKETGFSRKPVHLPFRKGDVLVSIVNVDKAKKVLGWGPEVGLDEGIKKTVRFFNEN